MSVKDITSRPQLIERMRHARRLLRSRQWKEFRATAILAAENHCENCGQLESKSVVLQVHHKQYHFDRKPWEYDLNECIVLCKGCHAEVHGIIRPFCGWVLEGVEEADDFGDVHCEACGQELKYVHELKHEKWGKLLVGCVCAEWLTGTSEPSREEKILKDRVRKRKDFMSHSKWNSEVSTGCVHRHYDGFEVRILEQNGLFRLVISNQIGSKFYHNVDSAKRAAFDFINDPNKIEWLINRLRNRRVGRGDWWRR